MEKKLLTQYPVQQIIDSLNLCSLRQLKAIAGWLDGHIAKMETDITEWKIDELEITSRTRNVLYKNNIDKVHKLLELESKLVLEVVLSRAGSKVKEELVDLFVRINVDDDIMKRKIDNLRMSDRLRNFLDTNHIDTIQKLLDLQPLYFGDVGLKMVTAPIKTELRQIIVNLKIKRQKLESEKRISN